MRGDAAPDPTFVANVASEPIHPVMGVHDYSLDTYDASSTNNLTTTPAPMYGRGQHPRPSDRMTDRRSVSGHHTAMAGSESRPIYGGAFRRGSAGMGISKSSQPRPFLTQSSSGHADRID
jgi:hypothetical protein